MMYLKDVSSRNLQAGKTTQLLIITLNTIQNSQIVNEALIKRELRIKTQKWVRNAR